MNSWEALSIHKGNKILKDKYRSTYKFEITSYYKKNYTYYLFAQINLKYMYNKHKLHNNYKKLWG